MILQINTKDQKVIKVFLKKNGKVVKSLSEENEYGSQVLLPLIMKLLQTTRFARRANYPLRDFRRRRREASQLRILKGIEVETGPGSFTGLRVGVSVANALAYSLGIPVNGKRLETELKY